MNYLVSVRIQTTLRVFADSRNEAVKAAIGASPVGSVVESVTEADESKVSVPVSSCEDCGKVLFEGDSFVESADGSYAVCAECQTA